MTTGFLNQKRAPSSPPLNNLATRAGHWQLTETGALAADITFSYQRADVAGIESTGATYVMSVSSKSYQFAPRTLSVTEELSDVYFVAESEEVRLE